MDVPAIFIPVTVVPGENEGEFIMQQGHPIPLSPRISPEQAAQVLGVTLRRVHKMREGVFVQGRDWFDTEQGIVFDRSAAVAHKFK